MKLAIKINLKLKKILNIIEDKDLEFLAKLDENEQIRLSELIQLRLNKEGTALYSTIAVVSKFLPSSLLIKYAQEIVGPEVVAKITTFFPVKRAIALAERMNIDFLGEVSIYLKPDQVVDIIEGSDDKLLIDITKNLLSKGHFEILGGFSEHLSPKKLKVLAEKLNDIYGIVQVAYYMKDTKRIIETAMSMSDEFLLNLMKGISYFQYYHLAGIVGNMLDIKRQIKLLQKLDRGEAARLAAHIHPEIIASIVTKIDKAFAVDIGLLIESEVLGKLFGHLPAQTINELLPYLSKDKLLESFPYTNLKQIEDKWLQFSTMVQNIFKQLSNSYQPLANALKNLTT